MRIPSAALVGAVVLAGFVGSSDAQTVRAVMHSDLKVVDPTVSTAYIVRNHGDMVWDQLVARDERGQVRPQMAEKWEVSADGRVYTFTLRDGLEWHDGKPVTSEDCIASIRRFLQRDSTGLRMAPFVKGYEAVSPKVFRIVLNEPYGLVLDTLSKPSLAPLFIMPRAVAETPPGEPIKPEQVIGSGPFVFKRDEWKPGEKVVYVRNPRYRPRTEPPSGFAGGKVVQVERVEWLAISDGQTALAALANGEVDLVEMLPQDLAGIAAKDRRVVVEPGYPQTYFFRPNWVHPPFDNPKVRQAAMIALNQEQMLRGMVGDEAVSALDVSVQKQVLELLDDIRRRLELAELFITHDLRVAAQLCDRVGVMSQGRLVEVGPAAQVLGAPEHAYTRALLAAAPGRGWDFARGAEAETP
jgi:peptide/nickel transport system substrate-binding protein